MGRKKPAARDEESGPAGAAAGGKSKENGFMIAEDEYSIGTRCVQKYLKTENRTKKANRIKFGIELSEDSVVKDEVAPVNNKNKGKKGSMKLEPSDDDEVGNNEAEDQEEEDALVMKFAGKKEGKGKKSGGNSVFSASHFGLLGEDGEEDEDDEKDEEERDEPVIAFSGKKKPSESKETVGSAFDLLDEDEERKDKEESSKQEDEDIGIISTGKNKSSKKKNVSADRAEGKNINVSIKQDQLSDSKTSQKQTNEEATETSKNKKGGKTLQEEDDYVDKLLAELGGATLAGEKNQPEQEDASGDKETIEADALKSKKKGKKGGKTGQEEEDMDKILAELGGAPPVAPFLGENNQPELEEAAGDKEAKEAGPGESSASKKKKKKKEKEKEKKAATSAPKVEEKQEVKLAVDKKVPKHVREMQKRLAKIKEAEERQEREEKEKKRKEEDEMRRKEEEERIAEERKRLKKEREKEKLQRKKQEGKLLTAKQKEEARRLEAMRIQLLANAGLQLSTGESLGAPPKRPLYQKKRKPKPQAQANEATTCDGAESSGSNEIQHSVEAKNVEELESSNGKDKTEVTDAVEENEVNEEEEDDDDAEWDAKSWDDTDLKLPCAFADEKVELEPEPVLKKEIKSARTSTQDVELPAPAVKSENVDVKNKISEVEVSYKNNNKIPTNPVKKNKKVPGKDETSRLDEESLRSPICCIMGHVDTGKTKLLDCIRGTNVQEGEAGGITQQIGATYIPAENISERTKELKANAKLKVPGLLVIDTPGHESFTNLRSRGSGLCDIAILVVDIMHGLEAQTINSLNLLKMRNTTFIVALNKVDRLYGWKTLPNAPINKTMKQQTKDVQNEFKMRLTQVITQFKEQGLNTELYYKNKEMPKTFSIVPTSAISGEGIPDLLLLLIQWTPKMMIERLMYSNKVKCTVLEVKVVEGHGTTVDVVLVNGVLHEGDQIVVCGLQGPIVTNIRALLTPHPMKELRIEGSYLHHKEIKAAQGIKITAQGLEHTIAGTGLYVVGPNDDLENIKASAMEDMKSEMGRIDKSGKGVYVQASTHGSLEALLEFLKSPAVKIPVSGINIGPVHRKDVMKASVMLEKKKEYGTILAFDVKVTPEAREMADELGVRIFCADIIYHLFDQFKAYINNLKEEKKKEASEEAVFPCILKIIPNCVFNKKDPIVLGVDILEGIAKVGTPLCVPQRQFIDIGRIASIENNHRPVDYAKKGQQVAIKIIGSNPEEQQKMFGRHFEMEDKLVSEISRQSLDTLKENYADELSVEEKRLVVKLEKLFKIA